ncbi:MAG: lipase [Pirellulaceae bacterium]
MGRVTWHFVWLWMLFASLAARPGQSQDAQPQPAEPVSTASTGPINFPTATLGGVQFWSDELVLPGWRIQRNALTEHYRLLDKRDFRRAWGTFDECQACLDDLPAVPLSGKAVVTLHGLGRSREAMDGIGEYLTQRGDYTWINVSYASSRRSLDEHAQSLARVLENLDGIDEIHLVCHSLGNLVVRRYLGESAMPAPQWKPDPRITRMVMLGPPNTGSRIARLFKDNQLFGLVTGPSGKELALSWDEAERRLATPRFEFGIIAGGRGNDAGLNPILAGDDDLIVAVDETRLAGADDFLVVPLLHSGLLRDERVQTHILRFLDKGYFVSADERAPIEPAAVARRPGQP